VLAKLVTPTKTYIGREDGMQLNEQLGDEEFGFKRRHNLIGPRVLKFVAQSMRSEPEIIAEEKLGRITAT
jgi:hypothetical protein